MAIGFRMNLFNIGVDGQYRLAAIAGGRLRAARSPCPPRSTSALIIVVAMSSGAMWAGIAGLLKVTRGVSEVISTIMLNFIATGIAAYLLAPGPPGRVGRGLQQHLDASRSPRAAGCPGIPLIPGTDELVYGLIVLAALVGVGYWYMLGRTRFGFDLRATGMSRVGGRGQRRQRQAG